MAAEGRPRRGHDDQQPPVGGTVTEAQQPEARQHFGRAHRRVRSDHATEMAEDYVEAAAAILAQRGECRVVDLATRFDVSHVTVNRTVARLCEAGLMETEPYRPIRLTAKGRQLARKCQKRHETVYRFLLALGVDADTAAIDAEGIEHHVSPQTLSLMESFADDRKAVR